MLYDREYAEVLEAMRQKAAEKFGITLQDNRVTLRWVHSGRLVSVSMLIEEVVTPTMAAEEAKRADRFSAVIKKYKKLAPDLEVDLYLAEHGELPK